MVQNFNLDFYFYIQIQTVRGIINIFLHICLKELYQDLDWNLFLKYIKKIGNL